MLIKRMQLICDKLEEDGSVGIRPLSEELGVTEKTIRQDLIKMENMGLLDRVRGGAVAKRTTNGIFPINDRRKHHTDEKRRIGRAAAQLIKDGDIVIIDNGTTTQALVEFIKNKRIIVITNDLIIANALKDCPSITLYSTGGKLRRDADNYSFVGQDTIHTIQQKNACIAFIGTSAFSFEQGLMTFSEEEAEVKRAIIHATVQKVCLADSTKLGEIALACFAAISDIDVLITDTGANSKELEKLEKEGGIQVLAV